MPRLSADIRDALRARQIPQRVLSVQEAARAAGISERYMRDLIRAGRVLGAVQLRPGGPWLVPVNAEMDRFDRRKTWRKEKQATDTQEETENA